MQRFLHVEPIIKIVQSKKTDMLVSGQRRLSVLSAREYTKGLSATIQASGKLGFSANTARTLGFEKGAGVKFALLDGKDLVLINSKVKDDDAFALMQSNGYYSVKTKHLFDHLGYDYVQQRISFDLVRLPNDSPEIYRLVERKGILRKDKANREGKEMKVRRRSGIRP